MANVSTAPTKDRADLAHPEATRGGVYFTPRVDIFENDKELTLFAETPGVRPEDVSLRYENGELLLHGRVQPRSEGKSLLLQEYEEGDFLPGLHDPRIDRRRPHLGGVQERRADRPSAQGRGG